MKDYRQEWIITVPAVWSIKAKDVTRACALAAGMTNVAMTTEPEAAAAYAMQKLDRSYLKIGDSITICDAGGGTVDLITYRITRLPPNLQVEESGICGGGKCGSVFLNRIFENWVDSILGSSRLSDTSRGEMMTQFDNFVSAFSGYYISLPLEF
jgi:molecular chaperone DnaK (HSP70)